MKKQFLFVIVIISFSLVFVSFAKAGNNYTVPVAATKDSLVSDSSTVAISLADKFYTDLKLDNLGLSKETVALAVKGYQKLVDSGVVNNSRYLTIVDMSQSSRSKRFYILDMKNEKLVWNTYVSHGKNSGVDMAQHFSNAANSNETSLGFYVTKTTYSGKHGLSLRISGLDKGFNDNAEARGVVVHGAAYVNASRASSSYMGRSQGCPALPENEYAQVIDIIKDGSVMFIYHPTEEYIQSSSLLN